MHVSVKWILSCNSFCVRTCSMQVVSGHLGWVRCIAVDPSNEWFATGSNDRVIKVSHCCAVPPAHELRKMQQVIDWCMRNITPSPPSLLPPLPSLSPPSPLLPSLPPPPLQIWELASGKLKLSLTGHISTIRALAVSPRQPYMFSGGEDKMVKCWDLEMNKVRRQDSLMDWLQTCPSSVASLILFQLLFYYNRVCFEAFGLYVTQFLLYCSHCYVCYCCLCPGHPPLPRPSQCGAHNGHPPHH